MEHRKVSEWLQIMANIGIVAGLLLVGIQIKQNSNLLKTQLLYEESQRAIALETMVVGERGAEVWAQSLADPSNMSLSDQRVMEALLWGFVEQLRATRMLAELGLLDDDEWRARVVAESGFYLGNEYGAAWWKNYSTGNTALTDDLVAAINDRLSKVDPAFTNDYFERISQSIED